VVDEDEMKDAEGKRRWREFMMRYEEKVNIVKVAPLILGGLVQFRYDIANIA
jgi:hypothetical protein